MFVLAAMLLAAPALAEDEKYVFEAELIHAPVPLYTFDWKQVWPRGMVPDADTIAGCASRVAFGDWRFTPNLEDEYADPWWLRVRNYGVFHCAANLLEADEREELGEGEFSRGLFAMIGEGSTDGRAWELWVLQKGFVPGSAYVLLAREAEGGDLVRRFTILQRRCPRGSVREASGMDVWTTRYCAVESRAELLALAKRMLREKPLGTLERVEDTNEEGPDTEASDPSD
ncbi:hypothetical protein [Erythrobacter sp. HL-111]|uniref:hypothetical protein n=1 Tax=Erythrobacter sp. HL-111 TaxID=1798193 RepID=UPI0006DB4E2F|nr:hypothetical protein [Erythrobacter sp. HL-111]KPP91249.1 MAG: hypothetical protein HLUCCO15_08530 [Erythrobacteraceae bacterium HL-111]